MRDRLTSLLGISLSCTAALLIVTACTSDGTQGVIEDPPSGTEAAEAPPAGPPIAFDAEPVSQTAAQAHFIRGSVYYGLEYEDGFGETGALIRTIDLEEQAQTGQAVPEHDRPFGELLSEPAVAFAESGEEVLLLHAYEEDDAVYLRAFDAADGSLRYTGTAPLGFRTVGSVSIAQTEGAHTLVTVTGTILEEESYRTYDSAVSFLFDTATGEMTWQAEGFAALRVEGEAVSGTAYDPGGDDSVETMREFQVRPLDGGEPSYVYTPVDDFRATWVGGGVVLLEDGGRGMGDAFIQEGYRALLVAAGTGTVLAETASETVPVCRYDGSAAIGCVGFGEEGVTVVSAEDGSMLWTGADIQDYLPPDRFRAAYQGVFYMDNEEGARAPVAIEAATGVRLSEDLPPDLVEVGPDYAVGVASDYSGTVTSVYGASERYDIE